MIRIYSQRNFSRFIRERSIVLIALILVTVFASCRKINFEGSPGTLVVFNALDDQINLYTNFSGSHPFNYSTASLIRNKEFQPNNYRYKIDRAPLPLALFASTDTLPKDEPVLKLDLDLKAGDTYSLFVYGQKDAAKHLLLKDLIPGVKEKDSLVWVRFINLSGFPNISFNIAGNDPGALVSDLAYEQNSGFLQLPADHTVFNYVFEVRDKSTGSLLFSLTTERINDYTNLYNGWFNRPNTLVFAGIPGASGTNAPKLFMMANR